MTGSDKNIPAMPANIPPVKTPTKATSELLLSPYGFFPETTEK